MKSDNLQWMMPFAPIGLFIVLFSGGCAGAKTVVACKPQVTVSVNCAALVKDSYECVCHNGNVDWKEMNGEDFMISFEKKTPFRKFKKPRREVLSKSGITEANTAVNADKKLKKFKYSIICENTDVDPIIKIPPRLGPQVCD